jgi:hypothetical protein
MTNEGTFVPAGPVEACIHAGDFDGVIAALRPMSFKDRKALNSALKGLQERIVRARWKKDGKINAWWGGEPDQLQLDAASAAMFFCGGREARVREWDWYSSLYPYLELLEPAVLRGFASELVAARPSFMPAVQRMVLAGLSDRPAGDEYILGLIEVPRRAQQGEMSLMKMLDADPVLLALALPRIFDVEGDGETSMAAIEQNSYPDNNWNVVLLELIRTGRLSRAHLIERCLHTLEQDWTQYRAGWFSRFHAQLAPSPDEMAPLAARYLGLCQSRIAPTVALALKALAVLFKDGRVSAALLLEALAPVMTSALKGQVEAALKLLDQIVKTAPGMAHAASALAQRALVHESPELHKKIIERLAAWGFDDATRADLEAMLPYVCAAHRDALAALAGAAPVLAAALPAQHAPLEKGLLSPLDPSRLLAPLDDVDELVQTISRVFENEHLIDDFERALEALVRLGPGLLAERARFSPVLKRSKKLMAGDHGIGEALALVLTAVFEGAIFAFEQDIVVFEDGSIHTSHDDLLRRIANLSVFVAQKNGLAPLSAPTHKRGFIDPLALAGRIAAHAQAGAASPLEEQVGALLRLAPGAAPEALRRFAGLAQTPLVQACRYALGDDVDIGEERALFCAAARIRCPGQDDDRLLAAYGDMGADGAIAARYHWSTKSMEVPPMMHFIAREVTSPAPLLDWPFIAMRRHDQNGWHYTYFSPGQDMLLYAAALIPASLEAFFAEGAYQIGTNIDWSEARWYDQAYLTVLMDRTVPVTPAAVKMLALALGGKEPGQTGMAIDALVLLLQEERADIVAVAGEIRWVLLSLIGTGARYAKNLGKAAQAHPSMPAAVVAALCVILDIGDAKPPKDTGALLELLLELVLANKLALPAGARDNIARFKLTGKARAAQKELLARVIA